MNPKEIRWRQRFDNFEKAYKLLAKHIGIENPSEVERAGIIQFFEVAFELAWKVMKDYLEAQGFQPKSPRETIKQAFQTEILEDGQAWLDALEDRNLTTHTYDENTAIEIEQRIKTCYFPAMQQFYRFMKNNYHKMSFDLRKNDKKNILIALSKLPEIEKAIVFGSRALGNSKKGSDVDLAIVGKKITPATVTTLHALLNEELPLPYFFDVIHYEAISNDNLKQHIDEHGVVLFSTQEQ